ncbi:MAG TPA: PIN domain-containing protein [Polyangia bacterium]|nr:PIN domain-containing protein [Polyangia bacterium]
MKKVVLDTNVYIDWINRGLGEQWLLGTGLVRYLSAVVVMELRAGARTRKGRSAIDQLIRAHASGGRLVSPQVAVFEKAGSLLRRLKLAGREVRSAAFVNDVLIALSARSIGAAVVTSNVRDFEAIRRVEPFALEEA